MRQKHSLLQKSVRQALHLAGWFTVPLKSGMGSYKGIADLYAIRKGRSVWIEIKAGEDRQSDFQRRFDNDICDHGGEYIVARKIDDLKKFGMIENIVL